LSWNDHTLPRGIDHDMRRFAGIADPLVQRPK
jgi:hypothetical protein